MTSGKKHLVLGFLAFFLAELGIEGKEKEQACRLLGKCDLNGYVDGKNHSLVTKGHFPVHSRVVLANESVLEPVSAKCEG